MLYGTFMLPSSGGAPAVSPYDWAVGFVDVNLSFELIVSAFPE